MDSTVTVSLIALGSFALALAVGGLGFAVYEIARLGRDVEYRSIRMASLHDLQSTVAMQADKPKGKVATAKRYIQLHRRTG